MNQYRRNKENVSSFAGKQQYKPLDQSDFFSTERVDNMIESTDGMLCMKTDYVQGGSGEERSGVGKEGR